ncbi:terminase gpP N-terminus-related DNA-binding protein [Ornithinimicrobium sp. Y1847]|uniref:terminase gpP N-terminus-related DNA-binding protein n=1 Tax=Ornithinimicrobium sp. Y1847 TaxID=3405419 RepID=UPI003B670303
MLSREEDIDAHALARQGWTISAIARHLGRDRKTIRAYLRGDRVAGVRKPAGEDPFEAFVGKSPVEWWGLGSGCGSLT